MSRTIGERRGEHGFGLHAPGCGARLPAAGGAGGGSRFLAARPILWMAGAAATLKYLADTWPF